MIISLKMKTKQIVPVRSMKAHIRVEVRLHSVLT